MRIWRVSLPSDSHIILLGTTLRCAWLSIPYTNCALCLDMYHPASLIYNETHIMSDTCTTHCRKGFWLRSFLSPEDLLV